MSAINYSQLEQALIGRTVERPNKASSGTLSGHAAGEPFEKLTYHILKAQFPNNIFKQYEYLNDLYLTHPRHISVEQKKDLFNSPVVLFLLSRSDAATRGWNPQNIFEEKQDDTADILYHNNGRFDIIDVKTRNMSKAAMAPNIISAYKLAQACALMLDNNDFTSIDIHYFEVEWKEIGEELKCLNAHCRDLFKSEPEFLYINWAAAMQIQFHVSSLTQTFRGTKEDWARGYIKVFVESAKRRCQKMYDTYVVPFEKYIVDYHPYSLF